MRIAIDLHGVADSYPEILMPLMAAFRACGHVIIVMSGPPESDVRNTLTSLGYLYREHYDIISSVVDFLKESGAEMWQDENGEWWASDEEWWASKAKMCETLRVDMLIDDSYKYMPYFKSSTKFVLTKRRQDG